ncbi:MD-2-related lipid-recognition domain-containing protein [Plasmodiophora brassicae]
MQHLVVVVVALVVAVAGIGVGDTVPYQYCSTRSADLVPDLQVSAKPFPPRRGHPLTVTATGTLNVPLRDGEYDILVHLDGAPVLTKRGHVCSLFPDGKCPANGGPMTVSKAIDIPSYTPPGRYDVMVKLFDPQSTVVFCVKFEYHMRFLSKDIPFGICDGKAVSPYVNTDDLDIRQEPDVPHPGSDVRFSVHAPLLKPVAGGQLALKVTYADMEVLHETDDICTLVAEDASCPLTDHLSLSKTITMPRYAPRGTYTATIKAIDVDGVEVACVVVDVRLKDAPIVLVEVSEGSAPVA